MIDLRWCDLLFSEGLEEFDECSKTEHFKKLEQLYSIEDKPHGQNIADDILSKSIDTLITRMPILKASSTDNAQLYSRFGTPFAFPPSHSSKKSSLSPINKRGLPDVRSSQSSVRPKRQKSSLKAPRRSNLSASDCEFPELITTSKCQNESICDDSECEVPPCNDPGCDGNNLICVYGDNCNVPTACEENCFERQNKSKSLYEGNWVGGGLEKVDQYKSRQVCPNVLTSYHSTSVSSPTLTLLSNNSPTVFSAQAEQSNSDGSFSPLNSHNDSCDFSYNHVEACLTQANSAIPHNLCSHSWDSPSRFPLSGEHSFTFQCPWLNCSRVIENGEQWNSHFYQEHIDPQMIYSCPLQTDICSATMATDPLAHLQTYHGFNFTPNQNGYRCPSEACQNNTESFSPLSFHDHLCHNHASPGSGQLQCRLWACGNWFDDPDKLLTHAMQNHTIPVWGKSMKEHSSPDELCSPVYQSNSNLEVNLESVNDQTTTKDLGGNGEQEEKDGVDVGPLICQQEQANSNQTKCSPMKTSFSTTRYALHHCQWKDLSGNICRMRFPTENDLQNHVKDSHLEPLDVKTGYYCRWDKCTREVKLGSKGGFSQRGKLERHMATHTNFKCSSCDICGASFSAPQAMRQHRRLHTGERPWKCQHCDKTFTQQSACTVHERTHTNEKPLECPICFKRFSESSNLTKHRKTHGERGAHVCTVAKCGKSFHRYDQLKRHLLTHLNSIKTEDKTMSCPIDELKTNTK